MVSLIQWKKLKVTCFVKQNEIAWFSVSITTLVIVISVLCCLYIHEEDIILFDPVKILFYSLSAAQCRQVFEMLTWKCTIAIGDDEHKIVCNWC